MFHDEFGEFEVFRSNVSTEFPVVSVVMSVFNGAADLDDCVNSVLGQDFRDFEFIVVDDGSSDATLDQLRMLQSRDPRIIAVTNRNNIGLTKSLIRAISLAQGTYLARQDVDDASAPGRFSRQMAFFPEADVVFTRAWVDEKRPLPRQPWAWLYRWVWGWRNPCVHGTYMMKKEVYARLGGYDPDVYYAQDYDLLVRILGNRSVRTRYIFEPLYVTRKDPDCISLKCLDRQNASFEAIRQRRQVTWLTPFRLKLTRVHS